ncbi:MAG: F0F1 ATP synthase subunit A [Erysipelothrix sp.]|nr:F0F1 ATP synthase subunit A [Erysipelothrix sp.]
MQAELFSILVVFSVLVFIIFWANRSLKEYDPETKPKGLTLLVMMFVEAMLSITVPVMGEKRGRFMAGYVGSIFIYILLSNWAGLIGLSAPTSNFSVTLALALITWVAIQGVKIYSIGISGYLKDFLQPFAFFAIPNIFGTIAPLISLSLRLFGNVLSGTMIMTLLYQFTAMVSGYIPLVGGFDIFGVIIAPWLHLYFDLFSGFLQAFLFISLTTIFIGIEFQEES